MPSRFITTLDRTLRRESASNLQSIIRTYAHTRSYTHASADQNRTETLIRRLAKLELLRRQRAYWTPAERHVGHVLPRSQCFREGF